MENLNFTLTNHNKEKLLSKLEDLLKDDGLYDKLLEFSTNLLEKEPHLSFDELYTKIHEFLINNVPSTIHDKFYSEIKDNIYESEQNN